MRLLLTLIILFSALPSFAQDSDCLAKSKDLFNEKEYPAAETKLKECLRKKPSDTDALISLAGVQMILGEFNNASATFKTALNYIGPKSPYNAYIYSRMGDIAVRSANLRQAEAYYAIALQYEPANINALVGKGICREKAGDIQGAAAFYKKALAVDFTNIPARERLIAMEPDCLSQTELLLALKERNIIDPAAAASSEDDIKLLRKMLKAEHDSAIEYLAGKYGGRIPDGFIVERDSGKIYVRKMLTLTGYNEVIAQLSNDAKQFFINKGIQPGTIFKLRDFENNMLFDDQGHLTDTGLSVYTKGLLGTKAYLLPDEALPATQSQIDALAKQYLSQGYSEITTPEYEYLLKYTRCSEQTLVHELRAKIININNKKKRVFLVSDPKQTIPFTLPFQYVVNYRISYHESKKKGAQPTYSSAFGMGNGKESKLCKADGTLMGGGSIK